MGQIGNYKFTGKEKDATGLYYFGARYYDPAIGRFITRDPVKGNIHEPTNVKLHIPPRTTSFLKLRTTCM